MPNPLVYLVVIVIAVVPFLLLAAAPLLGLVALVLAIATRSRIALAAAVVFSATSLVAIGAAAAVFLLVPLKVTLVPVKASWLHWVLLGLPVGLPLLGVLAVGVRLLLLLVRRGSSPAPTPP